MSITACNGLNMKALGIIGYHQTGKTTLATCLIRELTKKGYNVCSIKDIHSETYHSDTEGKNTFLHTQAGSKAVFAKGLYDSALLFPRPLNLKEMVSYLQADYLIIEGLQNAPVSKIVCAENTDQLDELIDDTCIGISGVISSKMKSFKGLPFFSLPDDLSVLISTIEEKCFDILPLAEPECCSACGKDCYTMAEDIIQGRAERSDCVLAEQAELKLWVGDREIVIVPFVQKLLQDIVIAFVNNLKDIDPKGNIKLELKR